MLTPLSALAAFRRDLGDRIDVGAPSDGRWLQVVALLQTAADVAPAHRDGIRDAVLELAHPDSVGDDGAPAALPLDINAALPGSIELPLRAALAMEDAARFHLAFAAHDALLRLSVGAVPGQRDRAAIQGVLLSVQGRIARQAGDGAAASDRYAMAEELGRREGIRSVLARAWVGYGTLARLRGNFPEARRWLMQALAEEEAARDTRQAAHQALLVAAATAGDHATAAGHGWAAYELALDEDDAVAALCDLAQLMRDAGRPGLALRGFSTALLRTSAAPRRRLPALGGAAVAAAEALPLARAEPLVRDFARQIDALRATTHLPYPHALALADLGDAYAALGDAGAADASRAAASRIAESFGFFELVYRVTEGATPVRRRGSGEPVPSRRPPDPLEGARPVLTALASFEAAPDVEDALAGASA